MHTYLKIQRLKRDNSNVTIINAIHIGYNCIVNSKTLIGMIAQYLIIVIFTNVTINGGVEIGSKCFIGSNVTTKDNIKIHENSLLKLVV